MDRSPSVLERFLYQECLAKVCLSFCEMVINIERGCGQGVALGPRSVTLIIVCLINMGTFFPRPQGYANLWQKSQEVFGCGRLNARGFRGVREDKLIGLLAKVFREDGRRDPIRLVWGNKGLANLFSGIPLTENGISLVNSNPIEEKKRHLWRISEDQTTRQLNAAHILTAFWKLNGRRFLEKVKKPGAEGVCNTGTPTPTSRQQTSPGGKKISSELFFFISRCRRG
ncbi:unnamed protein product [Tuber aestivum]|uniref:Uncharacterized protein n=1 Tax=Tuber aestivum TaxID=59557 RepID=A0A292Q6P6_9PEZI|nr:unnamed protein product [Tuber aestivum]